MSESKENCIRDLQDKWKTLKDIYTSETKLTDNSLNDLKEELISTCENLMKTADNESEIFYRVLGIKYTLEYEFAKILVSNKREDEAKEFLQNTLDSAIEHELRPEATYIILKIINYLSYMLSKNNNLNQSQLLLEKAENIYETINKRKDFPALVTEDLFETGDSLTSSPESKIKFEKIVTSNFLFLGCVYNKQGNWKKSAYYNHLFLQRQLDFQDYDPIAWATKAAFLATTFLTNGEFKGARHQLSAASLITEQYELKVKALEQTDENKMTYNNVRKKNADIARLWVKYGLNLFNMSKGRLMSMFYGDSNRFLEHLWDVPFENDNRDIPECPSAFIEPVNIQELEKEVINNELGVRKKIPEPSGSQKIGKVDVESKSSEEPKPTIKSGEKMKGSQREPFKSSDINGGGENFAEESTLLTFENLDLKAIEDHVPIDCVENSAQARDLFIHSIRWLKKSCQFYNLKDYPMEYVKNILDLSELYRFLAFFEEDIESQYSVQQKRADALETLSALVKEIRPTNYIEVNIELIRELAEVHLEITGLNLRRLFVSMETPDQTDQVDITIHKMDAMADMINQLENFHLPAGGMCMNDCASESDTSTDTIEDTGLISQLSNTQ